MGRKPKEDETPVSNRIEELRLAAGFTRAQLADKVGVHYQTIGYIERGEYSPSLVLALQIARALGEPIGDVFSLEEE
ncbi:MAG: helix-turn-helix transcriptional regulator [Micrococcales bacterium]